MAAERKFGSLKSEVWACKSKPGAQAQALGAEGLDGVLRDVPMSNS